MLHNLRFLMFLSAASFFVLLFAMAVRGDFREPSITASHESWPPMNVNSAFQKKTSDPSVDGGGTIGASDFYLPNTGRSLSQGPIIQIKEDIAYPVSGDLEAVAYCDRGYVVVGCSGTRHVDLLDDCDEERCGFVGAMPIDSKGDIVPLSLTRASPIAAGCRAAADAKVVIPKDPHVIFAVHAYCMKRL